MKLWIVVAAAILYGVVCGGVFTWLRPKHPGSGRTMIRATVAYTIVGLIIAALLWWLLR